MRRIVALIQTVMKILSIYAEPKYNESFVVGYDKLRQILYRWLDEKSTNQISLVGMMI